MDNTFKNTGKVVNLHYTDCCNYKCRFCHSHFQKAHLGLADWKKIIDNITNGMNVTRFNLAGGEPLLCPFVQGMVDYIHSIGVDCSIITNGSLLTTDFIRQNAGKISMIGISVDGLTPEQNASIGRIDNHRRTLSCERLEQLASAIRHAGMRLKINTVVNRLNVECDFSPFIQTMRPNRWKLLRLLHFEQENDDCLPLVVSDGEFHDFARRHAHLNPVVEDTEDMINSYIVVEPQGRLLINSGTRYQMTESLLNRPFAGEFVKISFNEEAYQKRYTRKIA